MKSVMPVGLSGLSKLRPGLSRLQVVGDAPEHIQIFLLRSHGVTVDPSRSTNTGARFPLKGSRNTGVYQSHWFLGGPSGI